MVDSEFIGRSGGKQQNITSPSSSVIGMRLPVKFGSLVILQYNDQYGCAAPCEDFEDLASVSTKDPLDLSIVGSTDSTDSAVKTAQTEEACREAPVSGHTSSAGCDKQVDGAPQTSCVPSLTAVPVGNLSDSGDTATNDQQSVSAVKCPNALQPSSWILCSCKVCGKPCESAHVLRKHMKVHHRKTPYQCRLCPAKFEKTDALSCHRVRFHGIQLQNETQEDIMLREIQMWRSDVTATRCYSDAVARKIFPRRRCEGQVGRSSRFSLLASRTEVEVCTARARSDCDWSAARRPHLVTSTTFASRASGR